MRRAAIALLVVVLVVLALRRREPEYPGSWDESDDGVLPWEPAWEQAA